MRVGLLIYGDPESISGGYLYDRKLVDYLKRQGDTVDIISLPQRPYRQELLFPPNLLSRLDTGLDIIVQDELVHPSVLRTNSTVRARLGLPVVGLVHLFTACADLPAWKSWFYRITESSYLRSIDALIVNSQHTLEQAAGLLSNRPLPPHIVARPAGNNFDGIISAIPGLPDDDGKHPLRILSVGNLIRQKGLHVLLQALHRLHHPDFQLSVCGRLDMEPEYARSIHQLIDRLGLREKVTLCGSLDRHALAALYASHDLFALPSVNEAYGISYLEAQQFGLPAIGTTAGGAGEIITDGVNGYLIRPADSATLATIIEKLQNDRPLLKQLGRQARAAYDRHPVWDDTCAGIRAFLIEQAGRRRTRH